MLLGVKAVIAESFERIHRSNLIGMGVLPLQFKRRARTPQTLGLTGKETFEIAGSIAAAAQDRTRASPRPTTARRRSSSRRGCASTRPKELDYYRHGGILHYVLRQLASQSRAA